MKFLNNFLSTALFLKWTVVGFLPIFLMTNISAVTGGVRDTAVKIVTHPYVTLLAFHSGVLMNAYYDGKKDAWQWDTMMDDGVTYGKATYEHWHSNKALANIGLALAVFGFVIPIVKHEVTLKEALTRGVGAIAGARAYWYRSYYTGRYGEPFPKDNSKYTHHLTLPLGFRDLVRPCRREHVIAMDKICWGLYGISLAIDPVWRKTWRQN